MFERGKTRGVVWNEVDLRHDQSITDAVLYSLMQNKVITDYLPTLGNFKVLIIMFSNVML